MTPLVKVWDVVPGAGGVVAPFHAIEGMRMKRVTQFDLYTLGIARVLSYLRKGDSFSGYRSQIFMCSICLESFCNNALNQALLPKAVEEAKGLLVILDRLEAAGLGRRQGSSYINLDGQLTEDGQDAIAQPIAAFETALRHGLEGLPTYVIERIGIYDADHLLTKADDAFPLDLRPHIPEKSLDDFKKAGSCLAFELHTASAFHGFRAVDGTLRAYCNHFTGGLPKQRDWGSFLREVRSVPAESARMPNTRTIELIDRIRAEDRNPLIHPETDLDALEANTAFDLCRTAITFMAMDIKKAP